jgi:transposase-like protein
MTANLQNPIFTDETLAREWLEARVWPNGPVCPHCGATGDDVTALNGKAHRPGLYQCSQCREQFTVTIKTVFERSKIPLSKWLAALFLLTSSKKGISAHQVHRSLGISYKSSWFMMHRLREAMRSGGLMPPIGGEGKVVEADETYFGKTEEQQTVTTRGGRPLKAGRRGHGSVNRRAVFALVERGGKARTFHIANADMNTVHNVMRDNIARETHIHTDESRLYNLAQWRFAKHETINHSADEYVRGDVTTNTVEGYFSIFKRGMKGVYQHCGEKHLHRYLAEFDFRYNTRTALGFNDADRASELAKAVVGKRLTYRRPHKVNQPIPF